MIQKLIRELFKSVIIAIVIFMVLLGIRYVVGGKITFDQNMLSNFGYTMLYGVVLYLVNALLFMYLDKVFNADRFSPRRVLIGFLSSFLSSLLEF